MTEKSWSRLEPIQELIAAQVDRIDSAGFTMRVKTHMPYGTQFTIEATDGDPGLINIYYSAKKGISFVDCSNNPASRSVISLLRGEALSPLSKEDQSAGEHSLTTWIGTDESGKGDFFGPLVVAGFVASREIEPQLISMGVTDSKKLNTSAIHEIGAGLVARFPHHINIIAPSVPKYNELYAQIGNLNRLLAWGHARVIQNLLTAWGEKSEKIDGVVADQFGDERYIKTALGSMAGINLIQRPRAESNIGVAAASIVARYTFEGKMARMSRECGMKLPFGASHAVVSAGRQFVQRFGAARLREVAKVHFKTFGQVTARH